MRTRFIRLIVICCSLFLVVQLSSAQQNCKAFHVIVQARWYPAPPVPSPPPPPAPYTFGWSGPFAGTLGGDFVAGFLSYAEPPSVDFPPPGEANKGKVGKEINVIFRFDFTDPASGTSSFQTVKDWGVFPNSPGQGLGNYTSTVTIDPTKGTGAFAGASGFFTIGGAAIAMLPPTPPAVPPPPPAILESAIGLWSPEVNGKICN